MKRLQALAFILSVALCFSMVMTGCGDGDTTTRTCPSCQKENAEDAVFCQSCGERLPVAVSTVTCPSCGRENDGDAMFCSGCGESVTGQIDDTQRDDTQHDDHSHDTRGQEAQTVPVDQNNPPLLDRPSGEPTVITENLTLGQKGDYEYAGIYEYEGDLTLSEGCRITSSGISQLVLVVNGTLTIEEGASIRVRNGYGSQAPTNAIGQLSDDNLSSMTTTVDGIRLFDGYYGRGGNGGNGQNGKSGTANYPVAGKGGGSGAGGYGGGEEGQDGSAGKNHSSLTHSSNLDNGTSANGWASNGTSADHSAADWGRGGNGNGGYGGSFFYDSQYSMSSGAGGGGGGYGGGVLVIYAEKLVIEGSGCALVAHGQYGGMPGWGAHDFADGYGQNGEGGLICIYADEYTPNATHWTSAYTQEHLTQELTAEIYDGGHSSLIYGTPQRVFVNGHVEASAPGHSSDEETAGNSGSGSNSSGSGSNSNSSGSGNSGSGSSIPCEFCKQTGLMECSACDGTGEVFKEFDDYGNKVMKPCMNPSCNGGSISCPYCDGDGIFLD